MRIFGQNSRRSTRFSAFGGDLFGPTYRIGGRHFDTPEGEGEGDETPETPAGGAGTATGNPTASNPTNRGSAAAADGGAALAKALKERKKAKALANTLLRALGIDPETVKQVPTGDPANPYRLEGVPNLDTVLTVARAAVGGTGGNGGGRGKAAQTVEVATLNAQVATLKKQIAALVKFITRTAVVEPIRAACVKYHAIDDDGGQFEDIVTALASHFRPNVELDLEDAEAEPDVSVLCVQRDGQTPFINPATNQPHTPDSLVLDFLTRRPKYRQAQFRAGPGAGGAAVGNTPRRAAGVTTTLNGNGNSAETADERTARAVAALTGGVVSADDLLATRRG